MGVERAGMGAASKGRSENLAGVATRLRTPVFVSDRAMPPESETVRAIESRLTINAEGAASEEAFIMSNYGEDGLCTDASFAPGPSSLYPDPNQLPPSAPGALSWRRVSGALYLPTGRMPRLNPGCLRDHPFLAAAAAVGCKQDLLLDLIVSDDHAQHGCYTFQIYKHGCWHQVMIDNFLPILEEEERLAFTCSSNEGELWPSLLEKACAKVHGSYYALEGGSVDDALVDLTGGVSEKTNLSRPEVREMIESGQMWRQLCSSLAGGAVVVARCKSQDPEEGPHGLEKNQYYTVLDTLQVGTSGPQLVRLHCAWPSGCWSGPWSSNSNEWSEPSVQPHMQYVASTLQDEGTFWMSFGDFTAFFNRLHTCSLFPSTWHQLTLHCGWQGPSAGGPYFAEMGVKGGEVVMGQSSTWCCNPQFRVTVRKPAELRICLGQQDPRVEHRRHVRKQLRRRSIGLQVLCVPLSSMGRRWDIKGHEMIEEIPVTLDREAIATFRADPDYAYTLVPYAGRAGDEGAFVLRVFSSAPLEMEQLPSPLSLVIGGHWTGHLAGGPRTAPTFGSNPQYMISCQQKTQIVLSVSRLDQRYAVVKTEFSPEQAVGLLLLEPEKGGPGSGLGRCTAVRDELQVQGEFGFDSMEEAVAMFTLEPEKPYIVVPCLAAPGIEAPFELRIMSGVPVELVPLPEVKCVVLPGEWREETSGGCDLNPVWKKNPRFLLALLHPTRISINLTRFSKSKKAVSIDDMIGFYVLRAEPNGEIKGDLRRSVVHETTFVTSHECMLDVDLKAGGSYVIMPCTYSPGRLAKFTLAVTAPVDFDLLPL